MSQESRCHTCSGTPRESMDRTDSPCAHDSDTALEIREATTRRDRDRFVKLPWAIYRDDPAWVPPLLVDVKEFLNPKKHPFYHHGSAAQFLAYRGRKPVGRILVSDDPRYNEQNNTNLGCFGMFESIDDPEVAHGLLDAAADWLRRRGRDHLMGPIDYSTNYRCGLLIEGFDTPPRILMPHNPPYYAALLESWGLVKNRDLYAWWFVDPLDMMAKWKRQADWIARKGSITVRPFSKKDFKNEVKRCRTIYEASRKDWWWACVELTPAEMEHFANQLALVGMEEHVLFAEVEGKPVGFAITMPDINEAIKPLNGRLTWFGIPINLFRLFRRMKRIKTARMMVLCVDENYRRRGVAEVLILRTLDYGKNTLEYTGAELSWTDEENEKISAVIQRVGARRYKTYRVYDRAL